MHPRSAFFWPNCDNRDAKDPLVILGFKDKGRLCLFQWDLDMLGISKRLATVLGYSDLTFIDAGQYNERWRQVHNLPPEVIDAFNDLKGNILVPIGWGMFTLALHDWYEPPVEISSRAFDIGATVAIPMFGEWVDIKQRFPDNRWWEPLSNRCGYWCCEFHGSRTAGLSIRHHMSLIGFTESGKRIWIELV